jgi:hypothetical protein
MGYVNTINEWTGSGNIQLPDKIVMVYWKSLQTCFVCDSWNMNMRVVRFDICMAVSRGIIIWDVTPCTSEGQY